MSRNLIMIKNLQENNNIESVLDATTLFLEKGYLENRKNYQINNLSKEIENFDIKQGIRLIKINKFVYDEKENILDKLSNVYTALYSSHSSLFLVLTSDGKECEFYLGVKSVENIGAAISILKSSLNGNFVGIEYNEDIDSKKIQEKMKYILRDEVLEVSTVTGIPSFKIDDKKNFLQGIEKLIEGMVGREFTTILIANPISYNHIRDIKRGYENIYNDISVYTEVTTTLNKSEAITLNETLGESIAKTSSYNLARTDSVNSSTSNSKTTGESWGANVSVVFLGANKSKNNSATYNTSKSLANAKTFGTTEGETETTTKSNTKGLTETFGESYQIKKENKTFITLIDKVKKQLDRIENAEGNGFWETGVFFLSEEPQNSIIAANIYNGIIRGEKSGIEKNGVYYFNQDNDVNLIKDYLYNFSIPQISLNINNSIIESSISSMVTTEELTLELNFPKKSIQGIDVVKMASFGRNNKNISVDNINIGKLYHLGKVFDKNIELGIENLTAHTFITGSTGSGKSNAVYCLIDELMKKNKKFLVIEPAKGEYKNVFGGLSNVKVYGTNKNFTELLKINPFSFNRNIHILEHIDRLVEIFNACWPMYAAMPAILKDSIEKAYVAKGWDLKNSINLYGKDMYPTFETLKLTLEEVINGSSYSDETKGNYKGALVTRVSSLNNGILGNIFDEKEIDEKELFDENIIVDISRIPSIETKSLIMGILFMKLNEYRLATHFSEDEKLKHVTILEEAHNLLKRTNLEQGSEGGNLQGKSVEMMTNAIAEMRTYGEGFIIVDQAPELLDLAVIRNTNTKICLKLPNLSDRELVGRAMDLNDEQIEELAKLETGVAAIIQSEWEEACLVKFKHMNKKCKYKFSPKIEDIELKKNTIKYLLNNKLSINVRLKRDIDKNAIFNYLKINKIPHEGMQETRLNQEIFDLIDGKTILNIVNAIRSKTEEEWIEKLELVVMNMLRINEEVELTSYICKAILEVCLKENETYRELYNEWNELANRRGLF